MLNIGGLQKVTLIDYPGKVAASVFLVGCNFQCPYCHNPELVKVDEKKKYLTEQDVLVYLQKRKGVLDGVCISGGEPLLFPKLQEFLQKIKDLGYAIKLDTNGSNPDFLKKLIDAGLIDYIAMDIKAPLEDYQKVSGVKVDVNKIQKSIETIMISGLDYEFRTTVLPKFHNLKNLVKIAKLIKGANVYYMQNFSNKVTLDKKFQSEKNFTEAELNKMKDQALIYVKKCQIRS